MAVSVRGGGGGGGRAWQCQCMVNTYQGVEPGIEEGSNQRGGHTQSQIHEATLLI